MLDKAGKVESLVTTLPQLERLQGIPNARMLFHFQPCIGPSVICMKEKLFNALFPEGMFASNLDINFNSWKGVYVLLSCIQPSVKSDFYYDLFHPCRGVVAKNFVAMNDMSGLGFCYELNGSLFSSLYSGACSRRTRPHDILIQVETIISLASLFRVSLKCSSCFSNNSLV